MQVCKRFNVPDPFFGVAPAHSQAGSKYAAINAQKKVFSSSTAAAAGFEELLLSVAPAPAPLPLAAPAASQTGEGGKGGESGEGQGLLSLVSSDAPVTARPPADVFKSIFDDSDDEDDEDVAPHSPAATGPDAEGTAGATSSALAGEGSLQGGGDLGSLEGMLSFFSGKAASEAPNAAAHGSESGVAGGSSRGRKSRWDVGKNPDGPVHVAPTAHAALPPPTGPPPEPGHGRARVAGRGLGLTEPAWKQRPQRQGAETRPIRSDAATLGTVAGDAVGRGPFAVAAARRPPTLLGQRMHDQEEEDNELRPYEEEEEEEEEEDVRGDVNTMAMLEAAGPEPQSTSMQSHAPIHGLAGDGARDAKRNNGLGDVLRSAIATSAGLDLVESSPTEAGARTEVKSEAPTKCTGVVFKDGDGAVAVPYKVLDLTAMLKVNQAKDTAVDSGEELPKGQQKVVDAGVAAPRAQHRHAKNTGDAFEDMAGKCAATAPECEPIL